MNAAKEMWDYILKAHVIDTPEEQAHIRDSLAIIRLKEDPTAEEMDSHLEWFNSLILRAFIVKVSIDENERIERFLATLPRSLHALRLQFRLAAPSAKTWLAVTPEYNLEAADRRREDTLSAVPRATAMFFKLKDTRGVLTDPRDSGRPRAFTRPTKNTSTGDVGTERPIASRAIAAFHCSVGSMLNWESSHTTINPTLLCCVLRQSSRAPRASLELQLLILNMHR
jgi:hypothetical protein